MSTRSTTFYFYWNNKWVALNRYDKPRLSQTICNGGLTSAYCNHVLTAQMIVINRFRISAWRGSLAPKQLLQTDAQVCGFLSPTGETVPSGDVRVWRGIPPGSSCR
jgi:hypothetical protein